jgi:hypothetical protein
LRKLRLADVSPGYRRERPQTRSQKVIDGLGADQQQPPPLPRHAGLQAVQMFRTSLATAANGHLVADRARIGKPHKLTRSFGLLEVHHVIEGLGRAVHHAISISSSLVSRL